MLFVKLGKYARNNTNLVCKKYLSAQSLPALRLEENEEYSKEANYPEILDLSFKARKTRKAESWHDEIKNLETVEEKQIKINMPRYYGYKVVALGDDKFPYNCLPLTQHYTRTVFEEEVQAVKTDVDNVNKDLQDKHNDSLLSAARTEIIDAIEFAYDFFTKKYEKEQLENQQKEKLFGQLIVEQVNRSLINTLAPDYQHLNEVEIDLNPRHEAFWFVGGVDPPNNVVRSKKGLKWQKEMVEDPVDRPVQYRGQPYLTLRHRQPLNPIRPITEFTNSSKIKDLPFYKYDARSIGYLTSYCHGTNIPGYWPGSPYGFGLIAIEPRDYMVMRNPAYGAEDVQETLHAHAIQSSYAWLLAQANYNGFSTFNDLTYPMNTQTIITNGRDWSFYEYQLNTTLVHSRHVHDNPKVNFCRGTKELQLFQEIDKNGKCVEFNENVVRHLLKFYTNAPIEQKLSPSELQPFLGKHVKRAADYPDVEQRTFLERIFKHLSANRPRALEIPEIYWWEKIYKIDNKRRPMEARRRFFELNINPWKRTLDQHHPEYIPRALRPDDKKARRIKFKKTYYP